jgi:hypothetical protein
MAVIEIAKIQVRRGQENQTGIPQLAGGEFAWATDNEKLYIGLKREDGGARDANIQILTENDFRIMTNLMSAAALTADYTWEQPIVGEETNAATITSPDNTLANKFTRSSQDKLDDFVSIADFGVIPSTTNDWTETIQNAIDHLFLDYHVPGGTPPLSYDVDGILKYNKKLYFPAGIYRVGGTVFIPRNTVIVGEGVDKTIIEVITTGSGVFQTVDYAGRRSEAGAPSNVFRGILDVTSTASAILSITGPGRPKNIYIEGMTLKHSTSTSLNNSLSLISLDSVDNAVIRNVKFQGHNTWTAPASSPDYVGVDIRGYGAGDLTSENIVIDNCQFTGLYYDVKSNFDTNHIVIQNSSFTSSTYGIAFSTTTNVLATDGPTYTRILNNKFQDIFNQGIFVGSSRTGAPTFHVIENNSFVKVGDQGTAQGNSSVGTSVIRFATPGNASVNNYFGREKFHNLRLGTAPDSTSTYYPLIDGRATIDLNSVTTATASAFADTPIMRLPITGNAQYLQLKYTAVSAETVDNIQRFGTLQIYIRPGFNFNPTTSPNQVKLIDDYNSSGSDGGLYWGLTVEETYKYVELFLSNPRPTAIIRLELQTKLML